MTFHGHWFARRPCRRDLLKAVSLLAGSTGLAGSFDAICCKAAAGPIVWPESGATGVVTVRGHHLFDMLDALGKGKSAHKTLGPVALRVRANPKGPIKVVVGADDICSPCEWWDHKKSLCTRDLTKFPTDNEDNIACDKNAIRVLGLRPGQSMPADDLYRLIRAKVDKATFAEQVCVACRLVNKCKETYEAQLDVALKALGATQPR